MRVVFGLIDVTAITKKQLKKIGIGLGAGALGAGAYLAGKEYYKGRKAHQVLDDISETRKQHEDNHLATGEESHKQMADNVLEQHKQAKQSFDERAKNNIFFRKGYTGKF